MKKYLILINIFIFSFICLSFLALPVNEVKAENSVISSNISTPRTIKLVVPRMRGDDVKSLQLYLTSKGYDCGIADGVYGTKTFKAVKLFQLASSLISDGKVGPKTRSVINNNTSSTSSSLGCTSNCSTASITPQTPVVMSGWVEHKHKVSTYTLTYTAGANGSITGTTPQTVPSGESGTEVTAVPDTGYHFVSWSDHVFTASRTDANITADHSVTANFVPDVFSFTILTTNSPETFTLPLTNTGTYDFAVDWGDNTNNTITAYDDLNATHTYANAGTYTISLSGTVTEFDFGVNPTDALKLTAVTNFIDLGFTILSFIGCSNLVSIADNMNVLTHLTTAANMFQGCSSLLAIPAGIFDGSTGITSFNYTFYGCSSLTSIPSGLFDHNTLVTDFSYTFSNCINLTSIPSGLFDNNTQITNFSYTFAYCSSLTSIPTGLFDHNNLVTDFGNTFAFCTHLTSIPSGLFDNNTAVINFGGIFAGCSITSIPTGLFDHNTLVTNFNSTFYYCTGLTSIPSGLFDHNTLVNDFSNTFSGCIHLTSIPTGLFNNNVAVTRFYNTFAGCSSLTSIPSGLFDNNTLVTNFGYTFYGCTHLTPIPTGLFDHNIAVTDFNNIFYGCSSLTSIPTGLFDHNTAVTDFSNTFQNCTHLTSIPTGLFDNNTLVTKFSHTFDGCSSLTSIPSGLFDNNTAATRFNNTFYGCSNLTSIPSGLFDHNTLVTSFNGTFGGCSSLTSIPSGLFDHNTLATDFNNIFYGCSKAQLAIDIFYPVGESGTRFLNKSVSFINTFMRDNFTGTQGTAPDLWNVDFGTGTPTRTGAFGGAGNSGTSLANYINIPDNWK